MPEPAWKRLERQASQQLGGVRNPLSGSASRHSSADVIEVKPYVEVKGRKRYHHHTLFREVRGKAREEGKEPILVTHEWRKHGRLATVDLDFLARLLKEAGYGEKSV